MSKLESMVGSLPTDSPMPSPDINAPSPSTSSVSVEDLNVKNTNFNNIPNIGKYMLNSSMENSINDTDIYVPTTVVSNTKSFITPEIYNTVQGTFNLSFQTFYWFYFYLFF